tara:strand:- start:161 stop:1042 length:882 start_codon:yes stop_codon:yes gene_type:complete
MNTLNSAEDLITSKDRTISGFTWQARRKVERAREFLRVVDNIEKTDLGEIDSADRLMDHPEVRDFLITSCMLSQKSLGHIDFDGQKRVLSNLIDFELLGDDGYKKGLINRYLLTAGDSLGGSMRNIVGQAAQKRLNERIIGRLEAKGFTPSIQETKSGKVSIIRWSDKAVILDRKPKFIAKSIDFIVVSGESAKTGELENPADYISCGELKGGIDPAGADEHWKTARSALERIAQKFGDEHKPCPKLIFIGAAIEASMAAEIHKLVTDGWLSAAANLNYTEQLDEAVDITLDI